MEKKYDVLLLLSAYSSWEVSLAIVNSSLEFYVKNT